MTNAIRMLGRDTLEIAVDDGAVVIDGELLQRAPDGSSGFWMDSSTRWRWADGRAMSDAERKRLVAIIPEIGRQNGWELALDEGPWEAQPLIRASFIFRGPDILEFKAAEGAANVPGHFTVDSGQAHFVMDLARPWTTPEGEPLSSSEVTRLAEIIRREAPANRVSIASVGRTPGPSGLA